jgi:prophage regulatory protein
MACPFAVEHRPLGNVLNREEQMYPDYPIPTELIRLPQVEAIAGVKRSQIYEMISAGTFPKPAKIGTAARWSFREIQQWVSDRLAERYAA